MQIYMFERIIKTTTILGGKLFYVRNVTESIIHSLYTFPYHSILHFKILIFKIPHKCIKIPLSLTLLVVSTTEVYRTWHGITSTFTTGHKSILIPAKSPEEFSASDLLEVIGPGWLVYVYIVLSNNKQAALEQIANATTPSLMVSVSGLSSFTKEISNERFQPARSTSDRFFHGWRSSNKFGGCRGRRSLHQQSTIFKYSRGSS